MAKGQNVERFVETDIQIVSQEGHHAPSYVAEGQFNEISGSQKVSQEGHHAPSYVADGQHNRLSQSEPQQVSQEGHHAPSYVADGQYGSLSQEILVTSYRNPSNTELVQPTQVLNVEAEVFVQRDYDRLHQGQVSVSLQEDYVEVQRALDGDVGEQDLLLMESWSSGTASGSRPVKEDKNTRVIPEVCLPFNGVDDIPCMLGIAPKQVQKVGKLLDTQVILPKGVFIDKILPDPSHQLEPNKVFTPDYFVALHNLVSAPGYRGDGTPYGPNTPNHLGARISLPHTKLKIDRWRHHLIGYEHAELTQHLEYGFLLGLDESSKLECQSRNHGSAYMWYDWVDKFVAAEVTEGGMAGPYNLAPWWNVTVSPLMTAHKKPVARRCCMDASFGDNSLNNATPGDKYLGQPIQFTYPKIEDYRQMVLKAGRGCWMWKRDLSRFFLQLPLDPVEYIKVGLIWRVMFFFFIGLAFGLRHSGLNGQRTTDAVSWILRQLGLETEEEQEYQVCNYVDDFGGVESSEERATEAYTTMEWLLGDLGLQESKKKAVPPSTKIVFLGVQFDSLAMEMSVPPEKITEVKAEIGRWVRKTKITKKELQSLLGKLFWVASTVKYSSLSWAGCWSC